MTGIKNNQNNLYLMYENIIEDHFKDIFWFNSLT